MISTVSRRLFAAFAWIIVLLGSQGLLSVLSQRHLIAEFHRLDQGCADAREALSALHGAGTEIALVVGSRHPDAMDEHLRRYREHMAAVEHLQGLGAVGAEPLARLREAYARALDRQYHFAFEMARQELAAAVPLHSQAVEGVALHLSAMEEVKAKAMGSALRRAVLGTLILGGLAIAVALFWAERLQREFTDRREAESSLAEALQLHRNLLEASTQVAIILPDLDGMIRIFNRGAELMLGWKAEEVIGRCTPALWCDPAQVEARRRELGELGLECRGPLAPLVALAEVRGSERRRWTFVTRNGDARTVDLVVSRVQDPAGRRQGFLWIATDITEQVKAEAILRLQDEQLRQSQKMDAIGQLAGGVAHDFNNMLAGILGSAEMLAESTPEEDPRARMVKLIVKASQRAADLTSKLLSFSRKGKLVSTPLDLHRVIHDTVLLLERSIDRRIEIRLELGAPCPMVVGDPSQLENALLNLCINARDAMPEGGLLTLRTREVELDREYCSQARFEVDPGSYVRLEIQDTGHGIPEEIRERVFEPFFTTKPRGKGTGLGLAAVYGIVRDHRGLLELESRPGQGTCFSLLLPMNDRTLPSPPPETQMPVVGGGTVLVIEDEDVVRTTASMLLQSLGYTTILASDGLDGLRLYEANRDRIRVVLLDMVMPGISGKETAQRLVALDPSVRILITSGFSTELWATDLEGAGIRGFLHKPYGKVDLAKALELALAKSG